MCLIIGLGWWYLFGDWMIGIVLTMIGIANLVRFIQMYRATT